MLVQVMIFVKVGKGDDTILAGDWEDLVYGGIRNDFINSGEDMLRFMGDGEMIESQQIVILMEPTYFMVKVQMTAPRVL